MKPLRLTAPAISERLWPRQPLDAQEVATWTPELRRRFYQAVEENRGRKAALDLANRVAMLL